MSGSLANESNPRVMNAWHAMECNIVLEKIVASELGLTSEEALKRLEQYGPNQLPAPKQRSAWSRFFGQFHNVLNRNGIMGNSYVLIAVAIVLVLQLLYTYAPPMWTFFQSRPLDLDSWVRIVAASSLVLISVEIEKYLLRNRRANLP